MKLLPIREAEIDTHILVENERDDSPDITNPTSRIGHRTPLRYHQVDIHQGHLLRSLRMLSGCMRSATRDAAQLDRYTTAGQKSGRIDWASYRNAELEPSWNIIRTAIRSSHEGLKLKQCQCSSCDELRFRHSSTFCGRRLSSSLVVKS